MPTYPANKPFKGYFYNNVKDANGNDDRVYTARDMRMPYATMFTDGVKPSEDGTAGTNLQVTAAGGMNITVAEGYAQIGGAAFYNPYGYTIGLDTAGSADRYDCVIIRNDDTEAVRAPDIYIKSLDHIPTVADLTRTGEIYELCVAYVKVVALSESVDAANITDTRTDGQLCNVMSGVGAIMAQTYESTYYTQSANQTVIPINIAQYNASRDQLVVIVEGRVFTKGTNYTVNGNDTITLAIGLPVLGTKVQFQVVKNINATGADTIVQEVAALRLELNAIKNSIANYPFNRTYISTSEPTAADGKDGDVWFVVEE